MKKETQHMVRITDDLYKKLVMKRAEYINKFNANYTMSEVIEILYLKANIYEERQK